ncbi:MAG TPA: hypothetical protein VLV30_06590 [Methanomicrobiales archaeon]|nr:hypothetical protein [Methanomicrobiales archaeon]
MRERDARTGKADRRHRADPGNRRGRDSPSPDRRRNPGIPEQDLEEFICCIRHEVRALVGGHYYYLEVREECPCLCRVPHLAVELSAHEVIDHLMHGISDEDLDHALRMRAGRGYRPGYYEISDHIEKKLRALLDA